MGSKFRPGQVYWRSLEERDAMTKLAHSLGRSFSNHVRIVLGLEPIEHGGARQTTKKEKIVKPKKKK